MSQDLSKSAVNSETSSIHLDQQYGHDKSFKIQDGDQRVKVIGISDN